jgi:hypothetical protein
MNVSFPSVTRQKSVSSPGPPVDAVVAGEARQDVVALPAADGVGAAAAEDVVVPVLAVEDHDLAGERVAVRGADPEDVVPAAALDDHGAEVVAVEREVRRPVVALVDEDEARRRRRAPDVEAVVVRVAADPECLVLDLGAQLGVGCGRREPDQGEREEQS